MIDFNDVVLKQSLNPLSKDQKIAFCLLLCERMMPALTSFARDVKFDDSIYRECLNDAWRHFTGSTSLSNYSELAEACANGAPDTEEFEHPLTSAALNTTLSIEATMSFLGDYDVDHLVEAAGLARDTAALYAQSVKATPPHSLGFKEVMEHPIVQQELGRQANDVKFLKSLPMDIPQDMIPLIKERAEQGPALLPPEN
jgi:uncharacterized protein YjaG (DUF416 family)